MKQHSIAILLLVILVPVLLFAGNNSAQLPALEGESQSLSVGSPSPSFSATDLEGKTHTLEEFRGKYVYIDVWATWCGPCRGQIPYLEQMVEDYKGKDIAFVSLSLDQNLDDWQKMARQMKGNQFHLSDNAFATLFQIRTIPRFILIDPEGNIAHPNMSRPSQSETRTYLDQLLKDMKK